MGCKKKELKKINWSDNIKYEPNAPSIIEENPAWSEEDEMLTLSIEQVMNCASLLNIVPEKIDKIKSWLKSLKQRIGG